MKEEQKHVELVREELDGSLVVKISPHLARLLTEEVAWGNGDVAGLVDHSIRCHPFSPSIASFLGWEKTEHWGQRWAKRQEAGY